MTTNGKTLTWRVRQLEKGVEKLDEKVDKILQNHLPHIQESVVKLKTRVTVAAIVNVGAILLGAAILKYL